MNKLKEKIKKILQDKGVESRKIELIDKIYSYRDLKQALVKEGLFSEEDFLKIVAEVFGFSYVDLRDLEVSPELKDIFPSELAFKHNICPLKLDKDLIMVATSNPFDIQTIDDLYISTGRRVEFVLAPSSDIQSFLSKLYSAQDTPFSEIIKGLGSQDSGVEVVEAEELDVFEAIKESERAPIVKLVDLILYEGLRRRVSDIHIEPKEDSLIVRYRIDGALHQAYNLPKSNQNAVIARLKIMSGLDITESRIPQDGRFKVKMENREVDFRVSSLPSIFGEKFVLRALDKGNLSIGLDKLGFSPEPLSIFQEAIKKPYGIILVTGPTGSGKSTTLYSIIQQLNTPDRNIITIEDPVEYQIEGITQIQVKPEIGLTFAQGLRAVLRQSPDIILVGEIRDSETADIAIKASLTGTLILSTLHTNDSCGAITRLEDMGIEPFLVASSLILVTAQRLARKICPKCKQPYKVSDLVLKRLDIRDLPKNQVFYCGKGCEYCNMTGYHGRVPLLECLEIDDHIREMIIKGASSDDVRNYAVERKGMKLLRDDALKKCFEGITTLEEVVRITTEE